jgi:hypothetical protein
MITFISNFCWGRENEEKRRHEKTREWSNMNFFSERLFWAFMKRKPPHSLFDAWSFLLVTFGLHLVRGPKAL